jgi:Zn-dependent protease with chaperone function
MTTDATAPSTPANTNPITITPYASERILKAILLILGAILWVAIVVSMVGIFYGIFFGVIFFVAQIVLVAHLRGSSIKLGPQQMPKLYDRIVVLSRRIGMKKVPSAYLMQSGGVLNAFATRFGFHNFLVLHTDMVRSCADDMDALDFIIAHELGHLHRGHLKWRWLKAPASFIPFLGSAYSRACEYTCDLYGAAACNDKTHRTHALCILAASARYAPMVNEAEFVNQSKDMDSSFMTLASWFASHPPLSFRTAVLMPNGSKPKRSFGSIAGAVLLAFLMVAIPVGIMSAAIAIPMAGVIAAQKLHAVGGANLEQQRRIQQQLQQMQKLQTMPPGGMDDQGDNAMPGNNYGSMPKAPSYK